MKLHRNAGLSVKGRELLVDRIEHARWSLTRASGWPGTGPKGPTGCWIAPRRPCW
jgi:hypothetical protein